MKLHFTLRIIPVSKGLGSKPNASRGWKPNAQCLGQGVETEGEHAKNVTGVAFWRGSKPNARGSKPNAWSISRGRRSTVALSLAKKWFDIILVPSMYYT